MDESKSRHSSGAFEVREKLSMPFATLKEYVTGFGTSHIFERAYFKDAYLVNAVRYLNEMWIVYTGGVAAAIIRK